MSTEPVETIEEAPADFEPEVVEASSRPEKKIAIVGFTYSRELTPWDDPTWLKWPCNNLWRFLPNTWDRLFDLHDHETINADEDHVKFLRGEEVTKPDGTKTKIGDKPVLVWKPTVDWPTAYAYPKDAILETFKHLSGGRYLTNSISWMIAMAIAEGATHIAIYGVDMAQGTEYAAQRPSCEYWLGIAEGAGIKVYLPETSDLLKCGSLYGAEDDTFLFTKTKDREKELKARLAALAQQQQMVSQQGQEFRDAQNQLMGALETTAYFRTVMTNPRASRDGSAKDAPSAENAKIAS